MGNRGEGTPIVGAALGIRDDGIDGNEGIGLETKLQVRRKHIDRFDACRHILIGTKRGIVGKEHAGRGSEDTCLEHRGRVVVGEIARRVVSLSIGTQGKVWTQREVVLVLDTYLQPRHSLLGGHSRLLHNGMISIGTCKDLGQDLLSYSLGGILRSIERIALEEYRSSEQMVGIGIVLQVG